MPVLPPSHMENAERVGRPRVLPTGGPWLGAGARAALISLFEIYLKGGVTEILPKWLLKLGAKKFHLGLTRGWQRLRDIASKCSTLTFGSDLNTAMEQRHLETVSGYHSVWHIEKGREEEMEGKRIQTDPGVPDVI